MKTEELFNAIRQNDHAAIARLLDEDPALLGALSNNITPILFSVYCGHPEIARLFIDRGARLSFGEAIALGERDRVLKMLDGDPSLVHSFTPDGFPAAGLAIFFRHPEIARELMERGADVNVSARNAQKVKAVHAAAAVCDHQTMRLLLDRGADPNGRQELGYTPLHTAAGRADDAMIDLLLSRGADPHAKGEDGKEPADLAESHGHAAVAARLRAETVR